MSQFVDFYHRINVLQNVSSCLLYSNITKKLKSKIDILRKKLKEVFNALHDEEEVCKLMTDLENELLEAENWIDTTTVYYGKSPPTKSIKNVENMRQERMFAAQLIIQLTFSQWADFSEKDGKGYFLHLLFFQCRCRQLQKSGERRFRFFKCAPSQCQTFHRCLKIIIECLLVDVYDVVNISIQRKEDNVMYHALKYLGCSKMFIKELLKNVNVSVQVKSTGRLVKYSTLGGQMHYLQVKKDILDHSWIPLCPGKTDKCCRSLVPKEENIARVQETLRKMEAYLDPRRRR